MIAKRILDRLCACGVEAILSPNGQLKLKAALGVLTTAMINCVREHKAAVVAELRGSSASETDGAADIPRKVGDTGDNDKTPHDVNASGGIVKAIKHAFRDRGVTDIDPVQFHRRQYGGHPEALRRDLIRLWRATYLEAKHTMTEPQAWDAAWLKVYAKTELEPRPSRTICVLPWSGNGWTPSKPAPVASAVSTRSILGETPPEHGIDIYTTEATRWADVGIVPAGTLGRMIPISSTSSDLQDTDRRKRRGGQRGAIVWLAGKQRYLEEQLFKK